jgi:hypothetical protein
MYAPTIRSANSVKRYRIGGYEAALLDTIESEGPIGYEYIVVVFEQGGANPFLFVTSERNDPQAARELSAELGLDMDVEHPRESGSHFLCVFDERGHTNLGDSDAWGDAAAFETAAMGILAERLGDEPVAVT